MKFSHKHEEQNSDKVTFCNLCFLSSFSAKTVLASLDKVSLLMLLDCTPVESFRLGWTSVTVLKKSIPRTAQRSCTVLTNSRTLCNLSLCQSQTKGENETMHLLDLKVRLLSATNLIVNWGGVLPFPFEVLGDEHENHLTSLGIGRNRQLQGSLPAHWTLRFLHILFVFVTVHQKTPLPSPLSVSTVVLVQVL